MKTSRQWHFPNRGILWLSLGLALIPEITAQRQKSKLNKRLGIVEGTVHYQPDPDRRWQQQTYYLRNPETGELAQAVVTLQAKGKPMKPTGTGRPNRVVEMDQVNFRFVPDTLSIQTGDSVEFKNSDEALHNVMSPNSHTPFNINLPGKGSRHLQKFKNSRGAAKAAAHILPVPCRDAGVDFCVQSPISPGDRHRRPVPIGEYSRR